MGRAHLRALSDTVVDLHNLIGKANAELCVAFDEEVHAQLLTLHSQSHLHGSDSPSCAMMHAAVEELSITARCTVTDTFFNTSSSVQTAREVKT
jgi:hypothetical protein